MKIYDLMLKDTIGNNVYPLQIEGNYIYDEKVFDLTKLKRTLLISGLEYETKINKKPGHFNYIRIELHNMKEFDKYMRIMNMLYNSMGVDFVYDREKVERIYNK